MGITERKERDRTELREKIVLAAIELFLERGFEKTSIRTIASAIEYSPATIYLHFKDKNELFYEISERAFTVLYQYLQKAQDLMPPIERLRAMGMNYIQFAFENPGYYRLMFIMDAPMKTHHTDKNWKSGDHAFGYLINTVQACQETGYFNGKDTEVMSMMIWSFMHGIVSLKVCDRMKSQEEETVNNMIYGAFATFNQFLRMDGPV